ncbi:MAG: YbaK/EbsC family protein, partial [Anaerolineae bacterium]
MNAVDLTKFIADNEIKAEIVHLDADVLTVADAAEVMGVQPDQIIKTVLFLADGEPVLVIASGLARIAWKRLADYLGVSRRRLKTGNAQQVQ